MTRGAWKGFSQLLEVEQRRVTQPGPTRELEESAPQEGAAGREHPAEIRPHNWREVGTLLGCLAFLDFPLVD